MLPSAFVLLDALPLTPNGKLDRRALPVPHHRSQLAVHAYPRTRAEHQLAQIWTELLNLPTVGIHDSFFNLGGHSLLAVRLLAHINQQFGHPLPLRTLFATPTIAQLAAVLTSASAAPAHTPIVALQPRGSSPPLFCAPGAGGSVFYLHPLARALGAEQPVYGLEALGLDGHTIPHSTVEAAAAYHLAALRQLQGAEPYYLLGHSFGGLIAYELAQQLQQAGATIGAVIILDGIAPGGEPGAVDNVEIVLLYERLLLEEVGAQPSLSTAQLQPLTSDERLLLLKQSLESAGALPPQRSLDELRGFLSVAMANVATTYHPTTVAPLPIHLVLAEAETEDTQRTLIDGWAAYGEVTVLRSPGTHTTMLYPPHVQQLASIVSAIVQADVGQLPSRSQG
jgi:thioesterase domain-containing protein/acyl carrier protein